MPATPHFASAAVERFPELAELFAVHGSRRISSVHLHHTFIPDHATFQAVARELGSDEASGLELCRRMWRYHTQELGWSDIAQHVTIDPAGRIWLNRSWDRPPASARGFNGSTRLGPFMIEMIGNFDRGAERPTEPQWRAALTVIAAIQKAFGLAPDAVAFHNEMTDQKSCPGSSIDKAFAIREIAAQHTASGGDGTRAAKRAHPRSASGRLPPSHYSGAFSTVGMTADWRVARGRRASPATSSTRAGSRSMRSRA